MADLEKNERTCGLNYEAEYNRLLDEHKALCEKHAYLKEKFHALDDAYGRLNAQMEIVHLIFGKG